MLITDKFDDLVSVTIATRFINFQHGNNPNFPYPRND